MRVLWTCFCYPVNHFISCHWMALWVFWNAKFSFLFLKFWLVEDIHDDDGALMILIEANIPKKTFQKFLCWFDLMFLDLFTTNLSLIITIFVYFYIRRLDDSIIVFSKVYFKQFQTLKKESYCYDTYVWNDT